MRLCGRLTYLVCAWLVAFALMRGGPANAASAGPTKHPDVKQVEKIGSAYPAMWKLVNGKSTVYLLGSVHVLPVNLLWRTLAIDQAIDAADIFVFEANLDFSTAEFHYFMDKFGYLPRGQTLHAPVATPSPRSIDDRQRCLPVGFPQRNARAQGISSGQMSGPGTPRAVSQAPPQPGY